MEPGDRELTLFRGVKRLGAAVADEPLSIRSAPFGERLALGGSSVGAAENQI